MKALRLVTILAALLCGGCVNSNVELSANLNWRSAQSRTEAGAPAGQTGGNADAITTGGGTLTGTVPEGK